MTGQMLHPHCITIRHASPEDADLIALVLAMALGGDESHPFFEIFAGLARRDDTQYSYRNALVALADGERAGAIVGYDGARLHELRAPMEEILRKLHGDDFVLEEETSAGEFYLDSVAVLPQFKGLGVGRMLIGRMSERAFAEGFDRVGLIVDFDNTKAEALYSAMGFRRVNPTTFLGHRMWHMQYERDIRLVIGGYGENIYRALFNNYTGEISILGKASAPNASHIVARGDNIYTFSESGSDSKIYSFKEGVRKEILCSGDDPCFITLTPDDRHILTADYSVGSVSLYPISDGEVEERVQKLQFEGFGPVAKRQQSPHIHQVRFLPKMEGMEGYWILAPDLGSDKGRVIRYIPNRENGPFLSHFGDIPFPPGSGPRHLDFDPVKGMMYCLSELSGELFVFKISADAGGEPVFEQVQTVLADECRSGGSGDIHIHPSGKYLYTSHRLKNDGLAVFRVCDDGTIRKSGYVHTKDHPRSFLITPDGRHILVASKNDLSIEVFLVDGDGMPVPTGCIASLSPDAPTAIAICK